ncbi:hypothetical protein BDZ89DRAFT_1070031 [Hymenopellis radicata]|nr:hypothetical protein BDZ89DRAFT_1070031 [Hymenopellis radicata]
MQQVLSTFKTDTQEPSSLLTSSLPALMLEASACYDQDDLPGRIQIRLQLTQLLHSLERLLVQNPSSPEELCGLAIQWIMALGRVQSGNSIFFATQKGFKESQRKAMGAVQGLLRTIQGNEDVMGVVRADLGVSNAAAVFRNVCGQFEVSLL